MAKATVKVVSFLGYWLLPDYRHPVRYALRNAGLERTPTDRPAAR